MAFLGGTGFALKEGPSTLFRSSFVIRRFGSRLQLIRLAETAGRDRVGTYLPEVMLKFQSEGEPVATLDVVAFYEGTACAGGRTSHRVRL
jgi:hypothetical protein